MMKHHNLLTPLLKTIDKVLFGIDVADEEVLEKNSTLTKNFIKVPEEDESDAQRSIN